jgi:hypothetical protein
MSRGKGAPGLRVLLLGMLVALVPAVSAGAGPEGQMTWAVHTSLVPSWFDPAENIQGTPFMVLSATHDALVKPMPGTHERAMFVPIWDFAFLHGVGSRVEESGLGLLGGYGFSAPYEDVKLKAR